MYTVLIRIKNNSLNIVNIKTIYTKIIDLDKIFYTFRYSALI